MTPRLSSLNIALVVALLLSSFWLMRWCSLIWCLRSLKKFVRFVWYYVNAMD